MPSGFAGFLFLLLLLLAILWLVGIRVDVQDLIYNADFGLGKKIRNDFVPTLGLGITW